MRQVDHPLFQVWRGMIRRCHNPKVNNYHNYGGRGISVCAAWRSDFWAFTSAVPPRPTLKHTLDRIDNDGNYEPGNVKWSTTAQQHRNARFNTLLTANGRTQILEDWATETGLAPSTIINRILRGWSEADAVTRKPAAKSAHHTIFPPNGYAECKRMGLNPETIKSRLRRGWQFADAISVPIKHEHARR